jgi:hypothetical protein
MHAEKKYFNQNPLIGIDFYLRWRKASH